MTRQLEITDSQRQSSDRADLAGVIYLLSGTLVGRDGIPNVPFYWSTREVTAFGQTFQAYLAPPQSVQRAMGFEPGAEPSFPEVRIPVRNLPFAHSESMVAAVTDNDFRFENTEATLRVAYLRPGQAVTSLVNADFTPLILRGFLGPPDEVTLDGFILPVYNRGARRNQSVTWPRMPSPETMSGQGSMDAKDAGIVPPVVVGMVTDWIKLPTVNAGIRGFTSSGYDAGTISGIKFRAITVGSESMISGNVPTGLNVLTDGVGEYGEGTGKAGLQIHYLFPIYLVASAAFDATTKEFTVTLSSGLAADIPRGAYVQQFGPGFDLAHGNPPPKPLGDGAHYGWCFGSHFQLPFGSTVISGSTRYGWLFPDGEVRPAERATWNFQLAASSNLNLSGIGGVNIGGFDDIDVCRILLERGTRNSPGAPCYYDPLANVPQDVAQQPEFTQEATAFNVITRPTGGSDQGTGTGTNADARDGSWATNVLVEDGHGITLTFPAASSPYVNGDTTAAVLHIIARASTGDGVNVTNGVATTYFHIPGGLGTAEPTEFSVPITPVPDFNQQLVFVRSNNGTIANNKARIVEAWWEFNLATTVSGTRTVDVKLTSGSVPLGPVMQFAELVVQPPRYGSNLNTFSINGGVLDSQPAAIVRTEVFPGLSGTEETYEIPYPSSVMMGLHTLLGPIEGDRSLINISGYASALSGYEAENIRLGFVWDEDNHPNDWTEIERADGLQSRSYAFYGASGHEMLFLQQGSGYDIFPILQTFRLPGVPGCNVYGGTGQPLYSRTRTTELVNQYEVQWDRDPLTNDYRRSVIATNEESKADIGLRRRDQGAESFYMHFPNEGNSHFTVAATLSGMIQFYADRQAFAQTRFSFDTAWIAHGLDRGSLVRVVYPVSLSPASYRNVRCEVESVEVSPIDGERFTITCRSIDRPQKGIEAAYIWTDVFETGDPWTDEILQEYDLWSDYWSVQQ